METARLNALLLEQNKEYYRLYRQHQELELRLQSQDERQAPSGNDAIEIRRIKKRKLVLKDRMATIAQEYTSQQSSRS